MARVPEGGNKAPIWVPQYGPLDGVQSPCHQNKASPAATGVLNIAASTHNEHNPEAVPQKPERIRGFTDAVVRGMPPRKTECNHHHDNLFMGSPKSNALYEDAELVIVISILYNLRLITAGHLLSGCASFRESLDSYFNSLNSRP
jgi:hypothetical protein